MKLKKPIEEFSMEELQEAKKDFYLLIQSCRVIINDLYEESDLLVNVLNKAMKEFAGMKMSFKELAEVNMKELKKAQLLVIEELAKRETADHNAQNLDMV